MTAGYYKNAREGVKKQLDSDVEGADTLGLLPRPHQNFQSVTPIGTIFNVKGFELLKTVLFLCALQIRMQKRTQFLNDYTVPELIA